MSSKALALDGKLVSFVTSDGVRLNGFLYGRNKGTCIINVHGMTGNFYGIRQMHLASALGKRHISFFSINTRGHDAVSHYRIEKSNRRMKGGTNFERFEESVFDIKAAVDTAKGMGFKNIILCGHSTGCQKVIYYQHRTKDKRIRSLILLGPADDYNIARVDLRKDFRKVAALARMMVAKGKGEMQHPKIPSGFSAQRFDSTVNMKRVESRILNYDGALREFASVRTPILAVFGTKEEFAVKRVGTYLRILGGRTRSARYGSHIVKGADHSFRGYEEDVAGRMAAWVRSL